MATSDSTYHRFLDLKSYIGWSERDDACSKLLGELLLPYSDLILDDFYEEIQKHPASARVITGGDQQIRRLKKSLGLWLADTLQSNHDEDYVARRWRIGYRHVEIGLDQMYVNAAFTRVRSCLTRVLCRAEGVPIEQRISLHDSLQKRLDLDLAIMVDAYHSEHQSRQVPVDQARLNQQKLLALLSKEALAGASLGAISDQAVAYLLQAFQSDFCEFMILEPDTHQLILRSASGWESEPLWAAVGNDSEPMFQEIARARGCVETDDWQLSSKPAMTCLTRERAVSSLQVAVRTEDEVYGLLGVHHRQRRAFQSSDHDFLYSIANLLANAIHRSRIENQRMQNARQLRRLVDRLPAGAVYVVDGGLQINSAVESMTGYSGEELKTLEAWEQLVLEETGVDQSEVISPLDGQTVHRQLKIRRADGRERLISQVKFQSGADEVWLLHDVTDEADRDRRRLQSERLAAIGQMITGLAHESRNALQRVQACTEMLELELEDNPQAMSLLTRSQQALDDLQQLYDEVRNYASPLSLVKEDCRVELLLRNAWDQLEQDRKSRQADLQVTIEPADLEVSVDKFRLIQVFRNFFENSLAASEDPVQIEVQVRSMPVGDAPGYEFTIRDNGPGLTREIADQIFEPFFTTKPKGSGLGMAIASRIITAHQGDLEARVGPGTGAEFRIFLPALASDRRTNRLRSELS